MFFLCWFSFREQILLKRKSWSFPNAQKPLIFILGSSVRIICGKYPNFFKAMKLKQIWDFFFNLKTMILKAWTCNMKTIIFILPAFRAVDFLSIRRVSRFLNSNLLNTSWHYLSLMFSKENKNEIWTLFRGRLKLGIVYHIYEQLLGKVDQKN